MTKPKYANPLGRGARYAPAANLSSAIDRIGEALGVPQRLLAALIGVSEQDLSNYRRGHRTSSTAVWALVTLAQANGLGHLIVSAQTTAARTS